LIAEDATGISRLTLLYSCFCCSASRTSWTFWSSIFCMRSVRKRQ